MIGWSHTGSRDYAELLVNGVVDEDIDAMITALKLRRKAIKHPSCPICGDPMEKVHFHDGFKIKVINP